MEKEQEAMLLKCRNKELKMGRLRDLEKLWLQQTKN